MYFHSQNLQYMQNLQRECTHSFFKKAAFRVDLHPLKNQKSLKTSGLIPTRNNKKSLIEWAHTPTPTPRHPCPPLEILLAPFLSPLSTRPLPAGDPPPDHSSSLNSACLLTVINLVRPASPPSPTAHLSRCPAPARQRPTPPRRAAIIVRGRPNILDFFRIRVYHRYMIRHRTERPLRSGLRPETISALILLTQQF